MNLFNSGVLAAIESATKTPELNRFQTRFEESIQSAGCGLSVIADYINGLTVLWDKALVCLML